MAALRQAENSTATIANTASSSTTTLSTTLPGQVQTFTASAAPLPVTPADRTYSPRTDSRTPRMATDGRVFRVPLEDRTDSVPEQ